MLKRTITGVVATLFAVGILALRDTPALSVVVAIFAVIAAREIEKVIGIRNKSIYYISLVFSGAVPLFYEYRSELVCAGINIPVTAVVVVYCVVLFMLMLTDFEHTKFEEVASVIVSTTFVPWSFSTLIFLNDMSETYPDKFDFHYDLFFILFGLFAAWLADSFAYFTGRFFGKHKMCPNISPKKTIEGAIGGVIGAVISNVVLFTVFDRCYFTVHTIGYGWVIAVSAVLAVIGICGDLTASVIKRNFGVKDFGNLFPGHGGVMDRFDSALFVLTMLYAFITLYGVVC